VFARRPADRRDRAISQGCGRIAVNEHRRHDCPMKCDMKISVPILFRNEEHSASIVCSRFNFGRLKQPSRLGDTARLGSFYRCNSMGIKLPYLKLIFVSRFVFLGCRPSFLSRWDEPLDFEIHHRWQRVNQNGGWDRQLARLGSYQA